MEDLNPRLRLRRPKGYPNYPNRPASYRKGYEYITLSLSSRAKTILIMNAIGDIIAIGGVGLVGFLKPSRIRSIFASQSAKN